VRLTVIGCSGSYPGPDGPASCYLFEAEGFRLVIDLGSGAIGVLQRHIRISDIDAVCLSHQHPDHCLDLCPLWVARMFGPDGRLLSYEQVLTMQKFGTIQVDHDNKEDVLRTIGAPSETSYFPRVQREVWSYPYKESGVWNSLMSVYFDNAGIVRKLENGPDPKFDPDRGRFFGGLRR